MSEKAKNILVVIGGVVVVIFLLRLLLSFAGVLIKLVLSAGIILLIAWVAWYLYQHISGKRTR